MIIEAEAVERGDAELFFEEATREVGMENPIIEMGSGSFVFAGERLRFIEEIGGAGDEKFFGAKDVECVRQTSVGCIADEFGGAKFAGGKVDVGEAENILAGRAGDSGEEAIFFGVEKRAGSCGAGSEDANDFATNEFFTGSGFFHLFADGDAMACLD